MMAGSDSNAVAGGLARHIPVLAATAIESLGVRGGGIYLDATFGGGGYTRAILETPGARVIAIDRDSNAIAAGAALEREAQGRLTLTEGLFSDLDAIAARHLSRCHFRGRRLYAGYPGNTRRACNCHRPGQ
jgi:16S rRNA (cytosine1402-N4)-methyltransferase